MNYHRTECPMCSAAQIVRSHRRGVIDAVLSWFFIFPYRCRMCACRFHSDQLVRAGGMARYQP